MVHQTNDTLGTLHSFGARLGQLERNLALGTYASKPVPDIATKAHEFYLDNLSFSSNQEHIYELLYRLKLLCKPKEIPPIY
jgi:hypothetical protein